MSTPERSVVAPTSPSDLAHHLHALLTTMRESTGDAIGDSIINRLVGYMVNGWGRSDQPVDRTVIDAAVRDPSGRIAALADQAITNAPQTAQDHGWRSALCHAACLGGWEPMMRQALQRGTWVTPTQALVDAPVEHLQRLVAIAQEYGHGPIHNMPRPSVTTDREAAVCERATVVMPIMADRARASWVATMPASWSNNQAFLQACATAWATSPTWNQDMKTLDGIIIPHRDTIPEQVMDIAMARCAGMAATDGDTHGRMAALLGSNDSVTGGMLVDRGLHHPDVSSAWTASEWDTVYLHGADHLVWTPMLRTLVNEAVTHDPLVVDRLLDAQVSSLTYRSSDYNHGLDRVLPLIAACDHRHAPAIHRIADWMEQQKHPGSIGIDTISLHDNLHLFAGERNQQMSCAWARVIRASGTWSITRYRRKAFNELIQQYAERGAHEVIGALLERDPDMRHPWTAAACLGISTCSATHLRDAEWAGQRSLKYLCDSSKTPANIKNVAIATKRLALITDELKKRATP